MNKHWTGMLEMHGLNMDQFKELSPVTKGRYWVRYYASLCQKEGSGENA